jgi:hypothetical protein
MKAAAAPKKVAVFPRFRKNNAYVCSHFHISRAT